MKDRNPSFSGENGATEEMRKQDGLTGIQNFHREKNVLAKYIIQNSHHHETKIQVSFRKLEFSFL